MKTLFTSLIIIICLNVNAQSQINALAGYKSIELGYSFQNEETLNYGFAVSLVDAQIVEKRANNNDIKEHRIKSDVVTALFGTIGATFEQFTITGKFGASYLNQSINNNPEPQNIYFVVGIQFQYKRALLSYDSVNALMIGYSFKF